MSEVVFRSGFARLVSGVSDYFTAIGCTALVKVGYRERPKQGQGPGGANRVVFMPGDPNGNGGKIAAPRDVGRFILYDEDDNPVVELRAIASWERQFTMSVWACDTTAPRDELAQIVAVEDLLEKTIDAIEQIPGTGGINIVPGVVAWTVPHENTFGAELLVGLSLIHPLMDAPGDVGKPGFTLKRVGEDA